MILKTFEIKKNLSILSKNNLFLIYGENNGLKKDVKNLIRRERKKERKSIELLTLYENEIISNNENFYNSMYSSSLFGDKKIITINDGTDKIIKIINDIIDKYPENVILIIFSGILEKKSKLRNLFEKNNKALCIPCYLDSEKDLEIILNTEIKENNISLSRESINLIIEKSNNDRNNLRNEIEKIKSFALNKKNLDIDEIKSIINFSGEYKSDKLVNECLSGNILQYKKILTELYTNSINQILLLRILSRKIHKLLNLKKIEKNNNNLESALNTYKPPIFWKDKPIIKKQLNIWKINDLKKTIEEINNIELLCKKNPNISKAIFFDFFNRLCKKSSNYS